MKSILTLIFSIYSVILASQSSTNSENINAEFQDFQRSQSTLTIQKEEQKIYYSKLPSTSYQTTSHSTFGIQLTDNEKEAKFNAAILFAISNITDYEFVADLFDKSDIQNSFLLKEMLSLSITKLPDTSTFKIKKKEVINELETVIQYEFTKSIHLKNPIRIIYYSSIQETHNGIERIKKTQVIDNNKVLYESNKQNQLLEICYTGNSLNLSHHLFSYRNDDYELNIKGGLWNDLLSKSLEDISRETFDKSALIKQVNDMYTAENKKLQRSVSRGLTIKRPIKLDSFLIPKFETKTVLELGNNKERIIERYNKSYKKSEINLQNNIKNGFSKTWSKSGNSTKNAFFKNGLLEGDYIENYSDLSPKIITHYRNGKITKLFTQYYHNGNVAKLYKYKNGKRNGKQKEFYENGTLKQKGRYKKANLVVGTHIMILVAIRLKNLNLRMVI
jgi:antitoxin component YwqK of YwqJK toxin-antitoxin module